MQNEKELILDCTNFFYVHDKFGRLTAIYIDEGKIDEVTVNDGAVYTPDDSYFEEQCKAAIHIIAKKNSEYLNGIYELLESGAMKDFCKELLQKN